MTIYRFALAVLAGSALGCGLQAAAAANGAPIRQAAATPCIPISTPADLNNVRYTPAGRFCLMNDIDLQGGEFVPIGDLPHPFMGDFDGQGHTIRNIKMTSAAKNVGLFGVIGSDDASAGVQGSVRNIRVEGAEIYNEVKLTNTGILVGYIKASGLVDRAVTHTRILPIYPGFENGPPNTGGLAGRNDGVIERSSSAANVYDIAPGGLVGYNAGTILDSHATGYVQGGGVAGGLAAINTGEIFGSYAAGEALGGLYYSPYPGPFSVGGLVGWNKGGRIKSSFALGQAVFHMEYCQTCGPAPLGESGGLVGFNSAGAIISDTYATGPIGPEFAQYGSHYLCGGLVGRDEGSTILRSYSVARLEADYCYTDGVANDYSQDNRTAQDYWVPALTRMKSSSAGVPLSQAELKSGLPAGFDPKLWSITPQISFPYLRNSDFVSPLATTVAGPRVLVFVPLGQFDDWNYYEPAQHRDQASKAAVFTMIAQALGRTVKYNQLNRTAIDTYFWEDTIQQTYWRGPVAHAATLGPLTPLSPAAALCNSPLLDALKQGQVAVARGRYQAVDHSRPHWMLVTSFTVDDAGEPQELVANDPWTGKQVRLDCATGAVTRPAGFPLTGYKLDSYALVSFRSAQTN